MAQICNGDATTFSIPQNLSELPGMLSSDVVPTTSLPVVVGDSGSGGVRGLVPAPAAGDANAGKFLKANGTWSVPPGGGVTPGGSSTQLQYNSSGIMSGAPGLTTDGTNLKYSGYSDYAAIANPAIPGASVLRVWGKLVSGRMLPKWMGPSGVDTPFQPALFGNNITLYMPNTGSTNGLNLGTGWVAGGTVSHPTPASTSPAIVNQMKRTRYANIATTANQALGLSSIAAGNSAYWRGNAAGLGGFFFFTRFVIELMPANTVRIFAGLQSTTTNILASDTVAGDVVGLWHDTTDGANVLSLVTRDNVTTTKTPIPGATIAAGQAFDFYMFCAPNDGTVFYRLDSVNAGTTIVDSSTTTTLPRNTIFMGPVVGMSNGTANTTVTTVAPSINRIYIESDH